MYMFWLFTPYTPHILALKLAMLLYVATLPVSFVAVATAGGGSAVAIAVVSCYRLFCCC